MAKTDTTRNKIKSKISAIKKISDEKKSWIDNTYDAYKDQLESTSGIVKKNITDFTSKIKGATQNKKDIFAEIIDIGESFLGSTKEDTVNPNTKPLVKSKILKYSKESARRTLQASKQIIVDETKKSFFSGEGICDPTKTIGTTSITLSPKSFDFLNMLKIDPESTTGKLMYESDNVIVDGDIKFNKILYNTFDFATTPYPYQFITKEGNSLFTIQWNASTQEYEILGLTPANKIGNFLNDYYNTIEYPDIDSVFKTAMQLTLGGDGTESVSFNTGMKYLNRLSTKLLSICGKPSGSDPLLNNTPEQLTEDEYDIENYFDFDDVEGIDLDDEDANDRRVLKFRDCNNFEVPYNSNHIEDFAYLSDMKTLDENIFNTLNKAAMDAYEQSDSIVTLDAFQLSLTGKYILQIPKAIIANILSPKIFFPIAMSYKLIKSTIPDDSKDLMKILNNLFFNIIKELFWKFLREFWSFIKKDLLDFVRTTAQKILANKLKKLKTIIQILINVLSKVRDINIGSCTDIFNAILNSLTSAINKKINIPIPGLLLSLSDSLPGYSSDRAYMNIIEKMEAAEINTGPIYGSENKLPSLIRSIIEGHSEEMDANSYVKIGLKTTTIPANGTNAYITGLVSGAGKLF